MKLIKCLTKDGKFAKFIKGHAYRKPRIKKYRIKASRYYGIYKPYFKYSWKNGYIYEHRYIMYIYLSILNGKPIYLSKYDDIHHRNNNKQDNRIENLELISKKQHTSYHNPIKDRTNTFCNLCKSKTTVKKLKKGKYYNYWINDINGFLCHVCNDHLRRLKKRLGITSV